MKSTDPQAKSITFRKFLSVCLIFTGFIFVVLSLGPIIKSEVWYQYKNLFNKDYTLDSSNSNPSNFSPFGSLVSSKPVEIVPVNKDFSLVIEKIGVNAPVVKDVIVTDDVAYNKALNDGIAHAAVSAYPSKNPGNVYLFAHASVNFWNLGKYANVFNLLRKLEVGDKIHLFYEGKDYVYIVVNREVLRGWNTYPLTRSVIEPTLTLQTCDPVGTTLNRLVITGNLLEVR